MDRRPALRDVECFVAVGRHRSFSRAATGLSLSQPAVSQAIGRLERILGTRLFDRTSRRVVPTAAGADLLDAAGDLLAAAEALAERARRHAEAPGPTIALAYPPLAGAFVAGVARRLTASRPPVEVEPRPAGWSAATALLTGGAVAAAILGPPAPPGYATTARFRVPVSHLALPAGDPVAALPRVRVDRLARHRVLLPRHRPAGGMWARLAAALRPGQHRVVADDLDDLAGALDLVAAGMGVLPVPRLLVDSVRRTDLHFVPLEGDLRFEYALAWPAGVPSAELMALIQAVQSRLRAR